MERHHELFHCRSAGGADVFGGSRYRVHHCARSHPDQVPSAPLTRWKICTHSTREFRHWSREADDRILIEYGLPPGPHPEVEIDHLIPLGVGGADDDRNLWPEPRRSVEPIWNAERKDRLEWKLRDLVCSDQLDVREAQRAVADDWTEAYRVYVREPAAINATEAQ
jgi:hypothetical protein